MKCIWMTMYEERRKIKKNWCTGDQKDDILVTEFYENTDKNHA